MIQVAPNTFQIAGNGIDETYEGVSKVSPTSRAATTSCSR